MHIALASGYSKSTWPDCLPMGVVPKNWNLVDDQKVIMHIALGKKESTWQCSTSYSLHLVWGEFIANEDALNYALSFLAGIS